MQLAERQLLFAAQVAERRQALQAIDAALHCQHASRIAAVIARFAGRHALLTASSDPTQARAARNRLDAEETAELARLALEHAAEKRAQRRAVVSVLASRQIAARRALRLSQRHQLAALSIRLHALKPAQSRRSAARINRQGRWPSLGRMH